MLIFDTDTHFTEPPDLWTSRLGKKWGDEEVFHVRWDEGSQMEWWYLRDKQVIPAWAGAMYGWKSDHFSYPPTHRDIHPATHDRDARLKAMDDSHVRVCILYPNVGGIDPSRLAAAPAELSFEHLRVYNDFLLEWTAPAADRFLPMAVVPFWDIKETVREIERVVGTRHRGIIMTGMPHRHGQPYLGDPHWDPLWAICQESGLSISFHVGSGGVGEHAAPERMRVDGPAAGLARSTTAVFLDNGHQVTDLLLCGVLARFPELNFTSVESGIGWLPFVLESCDYHFKKYRVWREKPEFGDALPSDLFRRQVYVNYWFERLEPWHIDALGADHILFETDFPHPTSLYGEEVDQALRNGLDQLSPDVQEKILWRNAAKLYKYEAGREVLHNDVQS